MLAKSAQRRELESAGSRRTDVYLILMTGTGQVSVQRHQASKSVVAEITLVTTPVESRVRRDPLGFFLLGSACQKARGIRDYVLTVDVANVSVDLLTSDPRGTFAAFEVENQSRRRDELPSASLEWATDGLGLMDRGVQVLPKRHTAERGEREKSVLLGGCSCSGIRADTHDNASSAEGTVDSVLRVHIRFRRLGYRGGSSGVASRNAPRVLVACRSAGCSIDSSRDESFEPSAP